MQLVMYCDGGESHLINAIILRTFDRSVDREAQVSSLCTIAWRCLKNSPSSQQSMLNAIGGYFETWWSVNPHWLSSLH